MQLETYQLGSRKREYTSFILFIVRGRGLVVELLSLY